MFFAAGGVSSKTSRPGTVGGASFCCKGNLARRRMARSGRGGSEVSRIELHSEIHTNLAEGDPKRKKLRIPVPRRRRCTDGSVRTTNPNHKQRTTAQPETGNARAHNRDEREVREARETVRHAYATPRLAFRKDAASLRRVPKLGEVRRTLGRFGKRPEDPEGVR